MDEPSTKEEKALPGIPRHARSTEAAALDERLREGRRARQREPAFKTKSMPNRSAGRGQNIRGGWTCQLNDSLLLDSRVSIAPCSSYLSVYEFTDNGRTETESCSGWKLRGAANDRLDNASGSEQTTLVQIASIFLKGSGTWRQTSASPISTIQIAYNSAIQSFSPEE